MNKPVEVTQTAAPRPSTTVKMDDIDFVLHFMVPQADAYRTARGLGVLRYRPKRGVWDISSIDDVSHDLQKHIKATQIETLRTLSDDDAKLVLKGWQQAAGKVRKLCQMFLDRREMRTDVEDFDADPDLLCVRNGVLDLQTGGLHKHAPEFLMTRRTRVAYDPEAPAALFEAVLERALPDPEVRGFFQRACGYAITGHTSEEKMILSYGGGANGKSTILGSIRWVLGDLAGSVSSSIISRNPREDPERATGELRGIRFGEVQETSSSKKLDEELVKRVASGEWLRCNPKYLPPYTFQPVVKLFVATNMLPRVEDTTDAIWRRLAVVPWEVQIPEAERDPGLKRRLEREEGPGILAWLVRGAQMWREVGLGQLPAAVVASTREYREEEDLVGAMLEECFAQGDQWTPSARLWDVVGYWCQANNGGKNLPGLGGMRTLSKILGSRGFKSWQNASGRRGFHCRLTDTALELVSKYEPNRGGSDY